MNGTDVTAVTAEPQTDAFGGVRVSVPAAQTDQFGGVRVSVPAAQTDQFGGVRVEAVATAGKADRFGGVPVSTALPVLKVNPNSPEMAEVEHPELREGLQPGTEFLTAVAQDPKGFVKALPAAAMAPLDLAGKALRAQAADEVSRLTGDPEFGGNMRALQHPESGAPLPVDTFLAGTAGVSPKLTTAAKIGQGVTAAAPTLGVGLPAGVAGRLVSLGFAGQMMQSGNAAAKALGEELGKNPEDRDPDKVTSAVSDLVQAGAFAPLAGAHGLKPSAKAEVTASLAAQLLQEPIAPGAKFSAAKAMTPSAPVESEKSNATGTINEQGGVPPQREGGDGGGAAAEAGGGDRVQRAAPGAAPVIPASEGAPQGGAQSVPALAENVQPSGPAATPLISEEPIRPVTAGALGEAGMGGAKPGEFSPTDISDVITPELRDRMTALGPEATDTAAQSFLKRVGNVVTNTLVGAKDAAPEARLAIRGWLDTVAGKTLPKTTLRDRITGEYGGRYAASGAAARPMADLFATDTLAGLKVDPAEFDAALKADNLLSVKDGYIAEGAKFGAAAEAAYKKLPIEQTPNGPKVVGDSPEARDLQFKANAAYGAAAKVNTLLGSEGFPFKNEAALQEYFKQPDVMTALDRHRDNWMAVVDPLYRKAADIDPEAPLAPRGRYSGARVNLNPVHEDYRPVHGPIVGARPGGTLTGTFRRRTELARRATGTGEQYVLNYHETMANTFAKLLEIANKRAFEDKLVESGNAVIDDPGKSVRLEDGAETKGFPLKRGFQSKNIYIRQSLANEYGYAANVFLNPWRGSLMERANKAFANAALFGLTDATTHIMNLGTAMFQVPGGTGASLLTDAILSGLGRADIPVILVRSLSKKAQEFLGSERGQPLQKYIPESIMASVNKALLARKGAIASLAQMNALRGEHMVSRVPVMKQLGELVGSVDTNTRLMLKDVYDNLARQGLVKESETARREFVNQAGNYNIRTVGPLMHFLRQTWLAPFATAGRNFAVMGVRGATLSPGVKAASLKAAAALRGNMLMKWIGTYVGLVGITNYLISGKLTGYPGTPLGSISWKDKDGKTKYFNVAALTGQSRALRTVGLRGAIEAKRAGLSDGDAALAARRDILNTGLGTLAGPGARFATIAATGYAPAVDVGRVSAVAPQGGFPQIEENLKAAVGQANPIVNAVAEYNKPGGTIGSALATQGRRLALNPGKSDEQVANYPQIVSMAEANDFMEWVIHSARVVPLENGQRANYVVSQIQRLPASEQKKAAAEIVRRRVLSQ